MAVSTPAVLCVGATQSRPNSYTPTLCNGISARVLECTTYYSDCMGGPIDNGVAAACLA